MPSNNDSLQCYQSRHTNGMMMYVLLGALMALSIIISAIFSTVEVAIAVAGMFALLIIVIAYLAPAWLNCGEKVEL